MFRGYLPETNKEIRYSKGSRDLGKEYKKLNHLKYTKSCKSHINGNSKYLKSLF